MNLMRLAALQAAVDQALLEGIDLHDRSDGPAWKRSLREHVRERPRDDVEANAHGDRRRRRPSATISIATRLRPPRGITTSA